MLLIRRPNLKVLVISPPYLRNKILWFLSSLLLVSLLSGCVRHPLIFGAGGLGAPGSLGPAWGGSPATAAWPLPSLGAR